MCRKKKFQCFGFQSCLEKLQVFFRFFSTTYDEPTGTVQYVPVFLLYLYIVFGVGTVGTAPAWGAGKMRDGQAWNGPLLSVFSLRVCARKDVACSGCTVAYNTESSFSMQEQQERSSSKSSIRAPVFENYHIHWYILLAFCWIVRRQEKRMTRRMVMLVHFLHNDNKTGGLCISLPGGVSTVHYNNIILIL